MAAGIALITVLDGNGAPQVFRVWSSNGLLAGQLSWLQALTGADGVNIASTGNPLPVSVQGQSMATPAGYQQIVGLVASTALTVPVGATLAVVQAENVDVRWRDDGTAPAATVGMLLYAGQSQSFEGDLSALRFIQTAATATLNVSYYA